MEEKPLKTRFTQIPNKLCRGENISSSAFRIIAIILADKVCFKSYDTLQVITKFGRKRISNALTELDSLSVLKIHRRTGTSNRYEVLPEIQWKLQEWRGRPAVPNGTYPSSETEPSPVPNQNSKNTRNTKPKIQSSSVEIKNNATRDDDLATNPLLIEAFGSEEQARLVVERSKTTLKTQTRK